MDEFIPIVGMLLVLGPVATWAVSVTPLGRALADRLRGRNQGRDDGILEVQDELERLHEQILNQDQRIEELYDRLEFTERLLAGRTSIEADKVVTPV